ncbi:hypothetical protein BKP37_16220 [Anaerobacillus alkalilacustris]|uniref:YprB ribonuclease H-like domain-containing protein n=1 Tax=Anaerobacillus alkalilacustris TaxID=393763 RepID=A0A1S2LFB3_9BACI|nr:ribonuclease H-like domain-containing protein [Anaerobacillus alkalilacustris]OIJ11198.1 hypothetical protein BKP37_16220 [Anaerobacillus alkalilacustris]
MSLKNKLARMKGHMQLEEMPSVKETNDKQVDTDWSNFKGKPLFLHDQHTIFREMEYPLDYRLGKHSFRELKEVVKQWNDDDTNHPLSANGLNEEQLIFFDTETTGLGGGTGNTIFLLGYCHLAGDVVKVKQFFLPGPADEAAFYFHFLQDVSDLSNLVTYNGKAFDWPQVRTRHTLVRDKVPLLPKFGHFDLLHAARRLWKDTLPSCRLSIVEKEILEIERVDDTPGSLAPLLYFDFLKEKNPEVISGVLKHNEVDVLSLIILYINLSKKILNASSNSTTMKETFEIARWYENLKQLNKACKLYEQVAMSDSRYRDAARLSLGLLLKKDKRIDDAVNYFQMLSTKESGSSIKACIELAKIHEHQFKDIEKAFYYSELAYERQKRMARLLKEKKVLSDIKVRIERLEKKIDRT